MDPARFTATLRRLFAPKSGKSYFLTYHHVTEQLQCRETAQDATKYHRLVSVSVLALALKALHFAYLYFDHAMTHTDRLLHYDAVYFTFGKKAINNVSAVHCFMTARIVHVFMRRDNHLNNQLLAMILARRTDRMKRIHFFGGSYKTRTHLCAAIRHCFTTTFDKMSIILVSSSKF